PTPRVYPSSVPSISATPPPLAVELTFTMRRAPSSAWKSTARASSSATRSCPMIGSSRRGSSGGTSTVLPRVDATREVSHLPARLTADRARHRPRTGGRYAARMPPEDPIVPAAASIDGRHFAYDVATDRLDVRVGDYVFVGDDRLGYVTSVMLERGPGLT